jgi:phosphoglycolate phosphatase-like HAD superfamily hydrolase
MRRGLIAVFDFDMTLLDTSSLKADRDARNWSRVKLLAKDLAFDPAIVRAVNTLADEGIGVVVASSAPRWYLDAFIRRSGFHVDSILGNADVGRSTIKAGQLSHLINQNAGSTLVYVGDDQDDASGAAASNVGFVHACWGGNCSDVPGLHNNTIDNFVDVIKSHLKR